MVQVDVLLRQSASRWRKLATSIDALLQTILRQVPQAQGADAAAAAVRDLEAAVARFEAMAERPEVTIAMAGTTSSGKSTVANMLIGERLLPSAVQEMSAGVVLVRHDDRVRSLTIEQTNGADWETGTWEDLAATDVLDRLERAMSTYLERIGPEGEHRARLDPPRVSLRWPTRIGASLHALGLPAGARLTIVDLPGLKYANDEVNRLVVAEHAARALCVVAYDSREANPTAQRRLLQEVVDGVKLLGGSTARMLFVLNKIDAFLSESDPKAREREFTCRVTRRIRDGLHAVFPERTAEIEGIHPIPLSSGAALYALLAERASGTEAEHLLRRLKKEFGVLFPDQQMDQLPNSPAQWSADRVRWFISEAKRGSRLADFEGQLRAHIAANLPELLLPDLVTPADACARLALARVDAIIEAYGLRERSEVEELRRRLEALYAELEPLVRSSLDPLDPLLNVATSDEDDLLISLLTAVPQVERELCLVEPDAGPGPGPLAALSSALHDIIQKPLNRLNDLVSRWMSGEAPEDLLVAGVQGASELRAAVAELRESPYGARRRTGGRFEGAEGDRVRASLERFAASLTTVANTLVAREARVQVGRLKGALRVCESAVLANLQAKADTRRAKLGDFPGLHGVFRGAYEPRSLNLPRVRFSPSLREWSHEFPTTRTVVKTRDQRSFWYWVWLKKKKVQVEVQETVILREGGIEAASLDDLLQGFVTSGGIDTLEPVFLGWLKEELTNFRRDLTRRLDEGMDFYRAVLMGRLREIEGGSKLRIDAVEVHRIAVHATQVEADRAADWRKAIHDEERVPSAEWELM